MSFHCGGAPARLLSVATALPDHVIEQADAAQRAADRFGGRVFRAADIASLFTNTGIATRRAVRPAAWYETSRSFEERNAVYVAEAGELWRRAAAAALDRAGASAGDVSAVVTVSSTGIATPSLEAREGPAIGLSPKALRTPVFGLGCAGGVGGLSIAARLAAADPGGVVLLVVVELCSLSGRPDEFTKANVVATALFGDGAAAAVFSTVGRGRPIEALAEHTWPDTLDIMGWRVDPVGLGVVLDPNLPAFVQRRFLEASCDFLGPGRGGVERFICHPGGTKVLAALEASLELDPGRLADERAVLAEYGNMSAPTVFFVLERALARGEERALVMAALGPGFSASFARLGAELA